MLVLQRLAETCVRQKLYENAEEHLREIIKISKQMNQPIKLVSREYNNLLMHFLQYDLEKAINLVKQLQQPEEKNKIPKEIQIVFSFNLGVAYLLKGFFVSAKNCFRECLLQQTNNMIKGFALNNLAVACWWHKSLKFTEIEGNPAASSEQEKFTQEN